MQAFLNLKVSYGAAKIVKTSEDGKVDNLTFTVTGNGVNQTVKTNSKGEIQIDNLMPGVYTVTEMDYDKYEPQESRRVTVVSGQVSTVNFNNKLKRGDLQIVKSSEDNLNEGVTFHLYGNIDAGIIPKFSGCVTGVNWFRGQNRWLDGSVEPNPGMIIFFDWDNKGGSGPQDGLADHVGIVQRVENGIVYTIEGNSGDSCRQNQYPVGHYEILGYGVIAY